jgi:MFS family permease
MTLFGSTANDAAFNAWVTDNTKPSYRGYVESVLSILPLVGLLIVAGGFGILTSLCGGYTPVFIGLGVLISICGVVGIFLFKDAPTIEKSGGFRDIIYGFRPSVIKKHLPFYATLLSVAIFGISIQTFMSYLIIYMKYCLSFSDLEYSAVFAIAILAGAGVNLYLGKLSDRMSKSKLLYFAAVVLSAGLLGMYFASFIPNENKLLLMILFGLGGFVMICGNIFSTALNGSIMRDHTPAEAVGKMQGVRMFASVLVPMLAGPAIGNALNAAFGEDIKLSGNDVLTASTAPAREIFLAGAIIALLAIAAVPLIRKAEKMVKKTEKIEE